MTVRPAPSPRQAQVTSPTSTHVEAPPRSARPFATVPLWVMFALQVLLLAAGYGGITVLFQKTQNHQINSDVRQTTASTLSGNSLRVADPMLQHIHNWDATAKALDVFEAFAPTALNGHPWSSGAALVKTFASMRSPLVASPFVVYVYEDFDTGDVNPSGGEDSPTFWAEVGCSSDYCYSWKNDTAYSYSFEHLGDRTADYTAALLSAPSLLHYEAPPESTSYVAAGRRIHRDNATQQLWTPVYLWQDIAASYFLATYIGCIDHDAVTGFCNHTLAMDINLGYMTNVVGSFGSSSESVVAIVNLADGTVMATNAPGVPLYDNATTNPWTLDTAPNAALKQAAADFVRTCGQHRSLLQAAGCDSIISIADLNPNSVLAGARITNVKGIELLLLDITPRSFYFSDLDRSFTVAVAVVVTICVFLAIVGVVMYLYIIFPVMGLIDNFACAAALKNERVVPTSSFILEVQLLSEQFDRMNLQLFTARAFLPQSMLQDDEGSSHGDDDSDVDADEGTVCSFSEGSMRSHQAKSAKDQSSAVNRLTGIKAPVALRRTSAVDMISNSSRHNAAALDKGSLLQSKRASIVVINTVGMHKFFESRPPSDTEAMHNQWLMDVNTAIRSEKGVVDNFIGDRVFASFNASVTCNAHTRRATLAALRLQDIVNASASFPRDSSYRFMSIGISTGKMLTGPVGGGTMRGFAAIGPCFTEAALLERVARTLSAEDNETTILIRAQCAAELDSVVYCYPVGECSFSRGPAAPVLLVAQEVPPTMSDEWLYEVENASSKNPFGAVTRAVTSLINRDPSGAAQAMEGVVEAKGQAVGERCIPRSVTYVKRMIEKCKQQSGAITLHCAM